MKRAPGQLTFIRSEEYDDHGGHFALDWAIPNLDEQQVRQAVSHIVHNEKGETKGKGNVSYKTPLIVIVPGIAGHSKQHYVRHFVKKFVDSKERKIDQFNENQFTRCHSFGWGTVIMNFRGCNCQLTVKRKETTYVVYVLHFSQ